jgi:hypothetical protein
MRNACADQVTRVLACRAGDRDRTGMTSLEGWDSAIELHPRRARGYQRSCRERIEPRRPAARLTDKRVSLCTPRPESLQVRTPSGRYQQAEAWRWERG